MQDDNIAAPIDEVPSTTPETQPEVQPITLDSGRSFKDIEELKKAYGSLEKDYTKKTQELSQRNTLTPPVQPSTPVNQQANQPNYMTIDQYLVARGIDQLTTDLDTFVKETNGKLEGDLALSNEDKEFLRDQYVNKGNSLEDAYKLRKFEALEKAMLTNKLSFEELAKKRKGPSVGNLETPQAVESKKKEHTAKNFEENVNSTLDSLGWQ